MASDSDIALLENAAATGSGVRWHGGRGVFYVHSATFSGATIKLQCSFDNSTWVDVDAPGDAYVTLTAAGQGGFELPPCFLRANVSGGPPTAVFAYARGTRVD
jgi:hypothetical protein